MDLKSKKIWIKGRLFSRCGPSAALAVFTSPFDGKDTVRVEKP